MSIAGRYVAIMELVLMFGFWLWMPVLMVGFGLMFMTTANVYRRTVAGLAIPVVMGAAMFGGRWSLVSALIAAPVVLQWLAFSVVLEHDGRAASGTRAGRDGRSTSEAGILSSGARTLLFVVSLVFLVVALLEVAAAISGYASGVREVDVLWIYSIIIHPPYLVFCMLTALKRVPVDRLRAWGVVAHALILPTLRSSLFLVLVAGLWYWVFRGLHSSRRRVADGARG